MTTKIKEKPILFSGPMVRAILEGRKTQTRRVVKPQPTTHRVEHTAEGVNPYVRTVWGKKEPVEACENMIVSCAQERLSQRMSKFCPYGEIADRLWVRETFLQYEGVNYYRATDTDNIPDSLLQFENPEKWRPSIFMPRNAARISLEIKDIGVERLQKITTQDAIAEGVPPFDWDDGQSLRPISAFRALWDSINESRGYGWNENPWVWVLNFEIAECAESWHQVMQQKA